MILALFWLTISTPFVCDFQQRMAKANVENSHASQNSSDEETTNPLGNSNEEKTSSSSNFSEEYMHDHHSVHVIYVEITRFHKALNTDTYIAFHGELLVPPPNHA